MIAAILRLLEGCRTIAVGASSPMSGGGRAARARAMGRRACSCSAAARHNASPTAGGSSSTARRRDESTRSSSRAGRSTGGRTSTCSAPATYPHLERRVPRLFRLRLPVLPRAARDPVPGGALVAHARSSEVDFGQRPGREPARRLSSRRSGRAGHGALPCSASSAIAERFSLESRARGRDSGERTQARRASITTCQPAVSRTPPLTTGERQLTARPGCRGSGRGLSAIRPVAHGRLGDRPWTRPRSGARERWPASASST